MPKPTQTLPTTEALQEALDAADVAQTAFADAWYSLINSLDLTDLTAALGACRATVEQVANLATDASSAIEAYLLERSERWIASERGRAVVTWNDELARLELDPDPTGPLRITIDFDGDVPRVEADEPSDVLPSIPDCPEVDWND